MIFQFFEAMSVVDVHMAVSSQQLAEFQLRRWLISMCKRLKYHIIDVLIVSSYRPVRLQSVIRKSLTRATAIIDARNANENIQTTNGV